ncbi:MAG: fibronectin type III domain-containing protein [Armatimonadota bacterium]
MSDGSVYRYAGSGTTWDLVGQPVSGSGAYSLCVYNESLYCALANGYVYKYVGGTTWESTGQTGAVAYSLCVWGSNLYCGTGNAAHVYYYYSAPPTPTAPTLLSASAVSTSGIDLAWTDNADNETGFKIERSLNGEIFEQIDTVGANVTVYSDTGLSSSTLYYYRVRAYNDSGNSDYSNLASATTLALPPPDTSRLIFARATLFSDGVEFAELEDANVSIEVTEETEISGPDGHILDVQPSEWEMTLTAKFMRLSPEAVAKALGGSVTNGTVEVDSNSLPGKMQCILSSPSDGSDIELVLYSVQPYDFTLDCSGGEFVTADFEADILVDETTSKVCDIIMPDKVLN